MPDQSLVFCLSAKSCYKSRYLKLLSYRQASLLKYHDFLAKAMFESTNIIRRNHELFLPVNTKVPTQ